MPEGWKKSTFTLKEDHGWKAPPGFGIIVIERGAIRFNYPEGWLVNVDDDSLKVRDCPEPGDNCVIAVSRMRLPLELADQVPVRQLVDMSGHNPELDVLEQKKAVDASRDGVEMAYSECRHMDKKEQREVITRLAIAREHGVYCLITVDFWKDRSAEFEAVWTELLRSLTLGMYVQDPTVGPRTQ